MPRSSSQGQTRSDATRMALITAATEVFARSGFEAVGTREIAHAAGVHPALIAYHFGNKEGLYLAVFEHMAHTLEQRVGPALGGIQAALDSSTAPKLTARRALQLLGQLCNAMLATLADEASGPWGPLMMREQQAPSPAFDLIYERFMGRVLNTLSLLVQAADPSRTEAEAKLTVVTLMGQMMVFRVARAGVMRHLEWDQFGSAELESAQRVLAHNLEQLFSNPPPRSEANPRRRQKPMP